MTRPTYPCFEQLTKGQQARVRRTFSVEDCTEWYGLAGLGPVAFSGCIPEPLIAGLFSYLLGVKLPGNGTMYLKQNLAFNAQAVPGESLTAWVTVTALRADKCLVNLDTQCIGEGGRVIAHGHALVMFRQ